MENTVFNHKVHMTYSIIMSICFINLYYFLLKVVVQNLVARELIFGQWESLYFLSFMDR